MRARRGFVLCFTTLSMALAAPACEDDLPERGPPIEQDDEDDPDENEQACVIDCKPLKQDCPSGWACLPDQPGFSCQQLASVVEGPRRKLHDECEVGTLTCEPGLVCLPVGAPGCVGSSGCCVTFCGTYEPECPEDTVCQPVFEEAAMCYEGVGVCVL